jgi:hypothetical protein
VRFPLLYLPSLTILLAGCAGAPATAPANAAAVPPPAPTIAGVSGETLQKGMTAAEVRRIMGTPADIKVFLAPSGKAKIWSYRRTIVGATQQVQVGTQPINAQVLGGDGAGHTRTLDQVPIYQPVHVETTETVRLLVFDGRFIEGRVVYGRRQVFE